MGDADNEGWLVRMERLKEVNAMTIGKPGDSQHEIINGVKLRNDGVLHRFINAGGVQYSAIYIDDFEVWSCEREHESQMIDDWNKTDDTHA